MVYSRDNLLEQSIDIGGTTFPSQTLVPSEEPLGYGARVTGQTGSTAGVTTVTSGLVTIVGLTGMTATSAGGFLTISGASSPSNNGTFEIREFLSASSVIISNDSAIPNDINNGAISWIERNSYMLQDDLNYIRTDRKLIKGTANWYDDVATYIRPTATASDIATNLTNISGKTTDATGFITERVFYNATVAVGNSSIVVSSPGNLKHSDSSDYTGVPVIDMGPYQNNYDACYVKILDKYTDGLLTVDSGPHAGEVIYGVTGVGGSTSPNSVEVTFYSTTHGTGHSTAGNPYTWESGFTDKITLQYGYFLRLDQIQGELLRPSIDALGSGSGGGTGITQTEHKTLRHVIHFLPDGPGDGFTSGAFKETLPIGSPFPTSIIWWESAAKLKKIIEKTLVLNPNKTPATIEWRMYDVDGVSLVSTVTDSIVYDRVFELSRTRSIT